MSGSSFPASKEELPTPQLVVATSLSSDSFESPFPLPLALGFFLLLRDFELDRHPPHHEYLAPPRRCNSDEENRVVALRLARLAIARAGLTVLSNSELLYDMSKVPKRTPSKERPIHSPTDLFFSFLKPNDYRRQPRFRSLAAGFDRSITGVGSIHR